MAKKSKIVKNDRRRAVVARYATRRAELKEIIRSPSSTAGQREAAQRELSRQPATPARSGCATAMPSTDVRAGTYASSACRGSACAKWPMPASSPVSGRPAGDGEEASAPATHAEHQVPKKNLLAGLGLSAVDYKDTATLRVFLSDRGKIRSRHVTGLSVQQQRQVAMAIKNAREMALLPYPGRATG